VFRHLLPKSVFTMKLFLTIFTILATQALAEKSYEGYQVLRTSPLTPAASALLRELQLTTNSVDFWGEPVTGRTTDINTPPHLLDTVKEMLASKGVDVSIMIEDVEKLIQDTKPSPKSSKSEGKRYAMNWDDYQRHDVLNEFIESLADANDFASIIDIGKSYEGRDMKVLAITKAGAGAPNVFLESGIHAREWISPAVATYIVRQLVEEYDSHPEYLDKINWYFIPSANPDGYEYTFTDDRLWRKTRSDQGSSSGCKGVDPNRNWGFHWGESGVSFDKCSEVYCGPEAFSEVEMQNIRDFVQTLNPVPVLGWCFHSYSQLWLWPYGYDYGAYPDNYQEIKKLAEDASDALYQVHGTIFDPINSADLYPAAGAADDWYKSIGMRYVFTTELRDTGYYGFVLPKEQIIPSGEEMWAGFETVVNKVLEDIQ